jgi:signal transduction histidine kinase/phage shock protein PspC (stress-responsive transcriptional regulator)
MWAHWAQRWHRGDAGPLRRDPEDRLLGGVAAGMAAWRGISATTVRIVLVVVALFSHGYAVPLYCAGWLLIPARGDEISIGARARHDSRGIALAVGLSSVLFVVMFLLGLLHDGPIATYGWPQVVSVGILTLIWRNAPEREQASMRHLVEPLESLGVGGSAVGRGTLIRLAAALALIGIGVGVLVRSHQFSQLLQPLSGILFLVGGIVLIFGPWWLRIARDLVLERQARARAEERADMAARLHDSVLQTLALIQRRADDPQQIVQLARAQERELRSWLFEGRAPGDADATTFAEGIRQIQRDVEARHGVPVEIVTVGDCPLDDDLGALLLAAREATVNAAKWSGATVISLYAEVEADKVEVAVRDRGKGFDPDTVPSDRKGLAESIHGRMTRHGGSAALNTAPGEGTKVTLTMPRTAASAEAAGGSRR